MLDRHFKPTKAHPGFTVVISFAKGGDARWIEEYSVGDQGTWHHRFLWDYAVQGGRSMQKIPEADQRELLRLFRQTQDDSGSLDLKTLLLVTMVDDGRRVATRAYSQERLPSRVTAIRDYVAQLGNSGAKTLAEYERAAGLNPGNG